jgi:hypothetical protein
MKTLLTTLVVAGAFLACQEAPAAVVVRAGRVGVAIGRPAGYIQPVYRPVAVRPIVTTPVITPAQVYWHRQAVRHAIEERIENAVENALHQ